MALPAFNSLVLADRLTRLDDLQQLAFGAACCERLLPNYLAFQKESGWGNVGPIRDALNLVWLYLRGQQSTSQQEINNLIVSCEAAAPDSEIYETLFVTSAQDACFAICSLLDYLVKTDPDKIVQVARYATDSVDLYVQEIENMLPNDPELEQRILNHPLMQRELMKQEKDISFIESTNILNASFIEQLRSSNEGKGNLASRSTGSSLAM